MEPRGAGGAACQSGPAPQEGAARRFLVIRTGRVVCCNVITNCQRDVPMILCDREEDGLSKERVLNTCFYGATLCCSCPNDPHLLRELGKQSHKLAQGRTRSNRI